MSNAVLLTARAPFARAMAAGEKTVELRRRLDPESFPPGTALYFYSAAPDCRIIGRAVVQSAAKAPVAALRAPEILRAAALTPAEFDDYFENCPFGYAIVLMSGARFRQPVLLKDAIAPARSGRFYAPQSYKHLTGAEAAFLAARPVFAAGGAPEADKRGKNAA